ncbi:MAG: hypothetical protein M0R76_07505 [Proteobacteria bacterium]|nr:hypothetical protein [Pseudomonadota bacterium]
MNARWPWTTWVVLGVLGGLFLWGGCSDEEHFPPTTSGMDDDGTQPPNSYNNDYNNNSYNNDDYNNNDYNNNSYNNDNYNNNTPGSDNNPPWPDNNNNNYNTDNTAPIDTDYVPPSSDNRNDPITPVSCDDSGNCFGTCWGCALSGPCASADAACKNNAQCAAMQSCLSPNCDSLSGSAWQSCYDNCKAQNPAGETLLQQLWACVYCKGCARDCASVGYDCSNFRDTDPPPSTDTGAPPSTDTGAPPSTDTGTPPVGAPLAANVSIQRVDAYQAFQIPLMSNGSAAQQKNNIVAGKDTLFRIYATAQGSAPSSVAARVTINTGSGTRVFQGTATTIKQGNEATLSSTLNVIVSGDDITTDMQIQAAVVDLSSNPATGNTQNAAWPASGPTHKPLVADPQAPLRIRIIPISVSGLLPDTDTTSMTRLRNRLIAQHPSNTVVLEVRPAITGPARITALSMNDWQTMLNQITNQRGADNPPKDYYYMGLVKPASTWGGYCGNSCYAGLSWVVDSAATASQRASVTVGYINENTNYNLNTILHELGHAQGRNHAPTANNPQGVDPGYPYTAGRIGVQGFDIVESKLYPANSTYDLMGYQEPQWVSDYTWNALLKRLQDMHRVYPVASIHAPMLTFEMRTWHSVDVHPGTSTHREPQLFDVAPEGREKFPVQFLDNRGVVLGETVGSIVMLSTYTGGRVFYTLPDDLPVEFVTQLRFETQYLGAITVDVPAGLYN